MNDIKKVGILFGTRPEVLKLSSLIQSLESLLPGCTYVIDTQQQFSLKNQALIDSGIKPNVILKGTNKHQLSSKLSYMLTELSHSLNQISLAAMVVQGDTLSTFAGALAAFYQGIPVLHVEAGLRSFELNDPFPEEGHRCMVSQLATRHYVPCQRALEHLLAEGVKLDDIVLAGNPLFDHKHNSVQLSLDIDVLVTLHRRENFQLIDRLFEVIKSVAIEHPKLKFAVIKHSQPRLLQAVNRLMKEKPDNLICLNSLPHQQFVSCLKECRLVVTDSGGVQEEAAYWSIRTLVVRNIHDRSDGLQTNTVQMVGNQAENFRQAINSALEEPVELKSARGSTSCGLIIAKDILDNYLR